MSGQAGRTAHGARAQQRRSTPRHAIELFSTISLTTNDILPSPARTRCTRKAQRPKTNPRKGAKTQHPRPTPRRTATRNRPHRPETTNRPPHQTKPPRPKRRPPDRPSPPGGPTKPSPPTRRHNPPPHHQQTRRSRTTGWPEKRHRRTQQAARRHSEHHASEKGPTPDRQPRRSRKVTSKCAIQRPKTAKRITPRYIGKTANWDPSRQRHAKADSLFQISFDLQIPAPTTIHNASRQIPVIKDVTLHVRGEDAVMSMEFHCWVMPWSPVGDGQHRRLKPKEKTFGRFNRKRRLWPASPIIISSLLYPRLCCIGRHRQGPKKVEFEKT